MRDEIEVAIQNNQLSSYEPGFTSGLGATRTSLPYFHGLPWAEYNGNYCLLQKGYTTSGQPGWAPLPRITFEVDGRLGLGLRDALAMPILGLADRQSIPTLTTTGNALTLRIIWPGYPGWDHQQALHAFDHTITAQQRTKEYIANRLASLVQEFYNDLQALDSTDVNWQLTRFSPDDIVLLELRNVSRGAWQPVLGLDIQ